jgi:hypothetical protein
MSLIIEQRDGERYKEMKKLGKTIFEIVISLILWFLFFCGIVVISIISPTLAHYIAFGGLALFSWVAYWAVKKRTHRQKHFICPNRCNIVQQGTNYCGLCGTRLIQK